MPDPGPHRACSCAFQPSRCQVAKVGGNTDWVPGIRSALENHHRFVRNRESRICKKAKFDLARWQSISAHLKNTKMTLLLFFYFIHLTPLLLIHSYSCKMQTGDTANTACFFKSTSSGFKCVVEGSISLHCLNSCMSLLPVHNVHCM